MIYDETYGNFLNPKCWEHNPTPNINNPCICLMAIGSIYIGSTGRIFVRTKRVNEYVCRQIDWEEVIAEGGDNYLLGANYNNTTNILTLTLVSGDIFTIDLNDLVDPPSVVTANLPQGSWVHNNGGGTLTTIKSTSSNAGNVLNIGADGGTYLTLPQLITLLTGENFGLHLAYNTSTNQVSLLDNDNQIINTVTINNVALSESNGVLTLTNLNGNQTFIDLKQVAASNPSSGVYQILDDYGNTIIIDTNETLTSLSLTDCTLVYIDEDGDTTNIDLTPCITNNQTLTSLSYNAGVLTYTDEEGNDTELNIGVENFLSAASYNNVLHQLTLTLTNGSSFIVDLSDLVDEFSVDVLDSSSINYSISGTGTSVDPFIIGGSVTLSEDAGNGLEIRADGLYANITNATETLTVISLLNNVITYVDENGDSTNLTLPITSLVDNGNGTLTFTNEVGDQLTFSPSSGAETITTLVDNLDGTFTYTSEDNTETVIDTNETLTTLTYNSGTGVLTYTGENGTPVNINLPLEYHLVSASFNSGTNVLTLTLSDSSNVTVDLSSLSDSFTETVTSITYNPTTRIITYTDENSFDTELDLSALLDDTNNYLTGASFNTVTNILTLTRQGLSDVTVDLSDLQDSFTDNYVDGISFDTNTSILTLSRTGVLADLTVDLTELNDETVFIFNDTNSLDVTMTGTGTVGDPFTLTGDVNIDSDIDNLISITTEGLLAKETITTISYNSGTTTITYTDESGGTTNIDLSTLLDDTDNYVTGIGFNEETNFLTIFRNNGLPNLTVDLSQLALYINNYVTGVSFNSSNNILTFTRNGGLSDLTVDLTPLEETVTTLVKNADGTITYTSENATQTTFSLEDLINMQESTPYIGTVSSLGDNTIVSAPGAGFRLKVVAWSFWNETTTATKGTLKTATVNIDSYYMLTEGCGKTGELQLDEDLVLGENEALVLNLSVATTVGYSVRVQTIAV